MSKPGDALVCKSIGCNYYTNLAVAELLFDLT